MSKLYIPSSKFSALLGRNRFLSAAEIKRDLIDSYLRKLPKDEPVVDIPEDCEEYLEKVELSNNDNAKLDSLAPEVKREIIMKRGTKLESMTFEKVKTSQPIYNYDNENKHYFYDFDTFVLGGKIDCLLKEGDKIVGIYEFKNRQKSFFSDHKLMTYRYDIDQLMCYFIIMSNLGHKIEKLAIVQQCNGEIKQTNYTPEFLQKRWNKLLPQLQKVVHEMLIEAKKIREEELHSQND